MSNYAVYRGPGAAGVVLGSVIVVVAIINENSIDTDLNCIPRSVYYNNGGKFNLVWG